MIMSRWSDTLIKTFKILFRNIKYLSDSK